MFDRDLAIFHCDQCNATRETPVGDPPPTCGHLTHDMNRFPDGGWVRVEQWTVHGPMRPTGQILGGNPFAKLREKVLAHRAARHEELGREFVERVEAAAQQ